MEKLKMAILGAGSIAGTMAETVITLDEAELYAVGARDLDRARAFAKKYQVKKAYGSYKEMLADPEVELVYIATPHSHHYKHARMCLEAGKHVLCEKSFTVNAEQAEKLFALAEEKKLLITEAIWTRYMPARKMIDEMIANGVIGEVTSLTANLAYDVIHVERIARPELAGGALLDVGVYPINFACMVFGDRVKECFGHAVFRDGVDVTNNITLIYEDGKMATLHSSVIAESDRKGMIYGKNGYMIVENINNPESITVYNKKHEKIHSVMIPVSERGYRFEVQSCVKAIREGRTECPEMPHKETVRVMKLLDGIRESWGYQIPDIQ